MLKKVLFFTVGFLLVITGISLSLRDWYFLVFVFKAVIGPSLAVAGLVLLTQIKE